MSDLTADSLVQDRAHRSKCMVRRVLCNGRELEWGFYVIGRDQVLAICQTFMLASTMCYLSAAAGAVGLFGMQCLQRREFDTGRGSPVADGLAQSASTEYKTPDPYALLVL